LIFEVKVQLIAFTKRAVVLVEEIDSYLSYHTLKCWMTGQF